LASSDTVDTSRPIIYPSSDFISTTTKQTSHGQRFQFFMEQKENRFAETNDGKIIRRHDHNGFFLLYLTTKNGRVVK